MLVVICSMAVVGCNTLVEIFRTIVRSEYPMYKSWHTRSFVFQRRSSAGVLCYSGVSWIVTRWAWSLIWSCNFHVRERNGAYIIYFFVGKLQRRMHFVYLLKFHCYLTLLYISWMSSMYREYSLASPLTTESNLLNQPFVKLGAVRLPIASSKARNYPSLVYITISELHHFKSSSKVSLSTGFFISLSKGCRCI